MEKFNSRTYWKLWFIIIIVFTVGNIFNIYLLRDIPWDILFFGLFIILAVIGSLKSSKLENYIKENHYEKWEEFYNGKNTDKFSSSKEYYDSIEAELDSEVKWTLILILVHFFSTPIFFIGLNVLYSETGFNAKLKYILL